MKVRERERERWGEGQREQSDPFAWLGREVRNAHSALFRQENSESLRGDGRGPLATRITTSTYRVRSESETEGGYNRISIFFHFHDYLILSKIILRVKI